MYLHTCALCTRKNNYTYIYNFINISIRYTYLCIVLHLFIFHVMIMTLSPSNYPISTPRSTKSEIESQILKREQPVDFANWVSTNRL